VDDVIPVVPSEGGKGPVTDNAGIAHHAVRGAVGFDIGFEYGAALPSVSHIELEDAGIAGASIKGIYLVRHRLSLF